MCLPNCHESGNPTLCSSHFPHFTTDSETNHHVAVSGLVSCSRWGLLHCTALGHTWIHINNTKRKLILTSTAPESLYTCCVRRSRIASKLCFAMKPPRIYFSNLDPPLLLCSLSLSICMVDFSQQALQATGVDWSPTGSVVAASFGRCVCVRKYSRHNNIIYLTRNRLVIVAPILFLTQEAMKIALPH